MKVESGIKKTVQIYDMREREKDCGRNICLIIGGDAEIFF